VLLLFRPYSSATDDYVKFFALLGSTYNEQAM